MPRKQKPWRTIIVGGDTGRFTWEQIEAAVRAVREKRERKAARSAAKPAPEAKSPSKRPASEKAKAAAPAPKARGARAAEIASGKQKTERKMPTKKKPWPTIITGGGTGRFTEEQIRAAVRAVKEESERKAARRAKRAASTADHAPESALRGDAPRPRSSATP